MIGPVLRWVANRIDPPKPDPRAQQPLPAKPVFKFDSHLETQRQRNALELMDEECCGYVLLQLRDEHGYMRIDPSFAVPADAWPAMKATLARCASEAERIYG